MSSAVVRAASPACRSLAAAGLRAATNTTTRTTFTGTGCRVRSAVSD